MSLFRLIAYLYVVSLIDGDKVKTTIVIDRKLWEEFRSMVGRERGYRNLSRAVEEALEDGVPSLLVARALEEMLGSVETSGEARPVRPLRPSDAGEIIREMRDSAA